MEWPKITAETPIEELQRIHKDIWEYVIEHGEKPKTPYEADCPACEYAKRKCGRGNTCDFCPINWGYLGRCTDPFSIFYMWNEYAKAGTLAGKLQAMRLAAIICDVEFSN